ncbi:hypothetical protein [Halorubrum salsamenti]|uniref:hypothetical protein n=1 Tax=Halorubrum salsamenti TaxID=2583990 RepID=UPI0016426CAC|nr:hypothetical protein [Halorubrum salsamenti]
MSSVTQKPKYHVVCRECPVEQLFDTSADAADLEREHAEETGHRIVFSRVR